MQEADAGRRLQGPAVSATVGAGWAGVYRVLRLAPRWGRGGLASIGYQVGAAVGGGWCLQDTWSVPRWGRGGPASTGSRVWAVVDIPSGAFPGDPPALLPAGRVAPGLGWGEGGAGRAAGAWPPCGAGVRSPFQAWSRRGGTGEAPGRSRGGGVRDEWGSLGFGLVGGTSPGESLRCRPRSGRRAGVP